MAAGLTKIKAFQSLVQQQLVSGHDYRIIAGTKKPSLWKPGAEKLCKLLELSDSYIVEDKVEDWEKGLFYYRVKCTLKSIYSGDLISQGLGSCNSKESRYRYRWVFSSEVPLHLDKKSLPTKNITTRKGNKATLFRIENEDPFSLANTLLKMAKKRAMVDAVLSAGRLSDVFNQGEDSVSRGEDESDQSLEEQRSQMINYFKTLGVQPKQVFDLMGITGVQGITSEHLSNLKQIAGNVKDSIASVEDFFGSVSEAQSDKQQDSETVPADESQASSPQNSDAGNGVSELDAKKAKVIDQVCTKLNGLFPGDSVEAQASRLRTLSHVYGKTVLDEVAKLPLEILRAGVKVIKSQATNEIDDIV